MTEKKIGKIKVASFGFGGYDDAMMGLSLTFGSDKEGWGVSDFKGTWANRSEFAKWTEEDQRKAFADAVILLRDTLTAAKKKHVDQLIGVPVEVEFDNLTIKSWRILEEVL